MTLQIYKFSYFKTLRRYLIKFRLNLWLRRWSCKLLFQWTIRFSNCFELFGFCVKSVKLSGLAIYMLRNFWIQVRLGILRNLLVWALIICLKIRLIDVIDQSIIITLWLIDPSCWKWRLKCWIGSLDLWDNWSHQSRKHISFL